MWVCGLVLKVMNQSIQLQGMGTLRQHFCFKSTVQLTNDH